MLQYRDFEERVELVSEKIPAKEIVRRAIYNINRKITKSDVVELCPSIGKKISRVSFKNN